jgi:hypothetical protein
MDSSDKFAGPTLGRLPLLLVLLALLLLMPISIAQTTTSGGLAGVVTDPSNAVIPNADVEIRDNAKGTHQATKTDREGVYRFFFLAPERYTLTVSHVGFRIESRTVTVLLGPPVSVTVTLQVAQASTSLLVTAEAPLIQAENGDLSATMNQKQISEVPNPGNDLTYVAQTAPGVVMNTDIQGGANFSILGMPGNSYLYTIDGMNDNDNSINLSLGGSLFLLLGQNEIQEATVVSAGYAGQFGGSAGGNISYITKSGSNKFHGNAQYYWNGRVFNANDWFNNAFGAPRPFDIANQWAGSLGGPIKKDKLFFFFDTEGLRLVLPQSFPVLIPSSQFEDATIANIDSDPRFGPASATDAFYKKIFALYNAAPGAGSATLGSTNINDPSGCTGFTGLGTDPTTNLPVPCARYFFSNRSRPSQDSLVSGRLDWNAGKSDRAFLRLQYDHGRSPINTDPVNSAFDADFNQPWWQAQVIETHTFGSSAASQFLVAGSYFAPIFAVKNPTQALSAFPTFLNFNVPGTFANLGGGDQIDLFGFGRYNTQYQVSEDIVKTRAKQKFGFGAIFARTYWSELPGRSSTIGVLTPQSLDAFYQGGIDPATPQTDFTGLAQSFTSQASLPISFLNFGIYGQDEWHARSNLTLTFALRAEHYSNPSCRTRCFARLAGPFESLSHDPKQPYNRAIVTNQQHAFENTDNILWSPRVSFAWQPLGVSHNTVIRGGVGIFYDPLPGRLLDSFSANPPLFNSYTPSKNNLTPDEKSSLFKDACTSNAAFLNGFYTGQTLADIQRVAPDFSPPAIAVPGRTTHSPQFQRWNLEFQQTLGSATSLTVGYFGNHGIRELVQNPNANAYGFGSLPAALCTSPPVAPCADSRFSKVTQIDTNAVSNYNGIVTSFKHQFTRWTQGMFQANYTYGHALDEISNGGVIIFTGVTILSAQDPGNLRGNYGPADYDIRHSFNASYVWEVPVKAALRGHGSDYFVKGWQISGTIFARTGFPYTVIDPQESSKLVSKNYFGLLYAVPVGALGPSNSCGEGAAIPLAPNPCQPPQISNGNPDLNARFVQQGCETGFNTGNLPGPKGPCDGSPVSFAQGRNRFRGPNYFNTDFAIMKNTRVPGWETAVLGVGFQFFNFFNHPNFGIPDPGISDPLFGQVFYPAQPPTGILGSGFGGDVAPRMIQLKAQLVF